MGRAGWVVDFSSAAVKLLAHHTLIPAWPRKSPRNHKLQNKRSRIPTILKVRRGNSEEASRDRMQGEGRQQRKGTDKQVRKGTERGGR